VDLAQGVADDARGVEHVLGAKNACRLVRILGRFVEQIDHGLGDGEIAGGEKHQCAIAGALERGHLAERVDLIDAGVGPRVGQ
jgi:hypothetical protein